MLDIISSNDLSSLQISSIVAQLSCNQTDISDAECLVQKFSDAIPSLMHDVSCATIDDFLNFNDKYMRYHESHQLLEDIHFICNSMYKNNDISKETYVKFMEKFYGKSTEQMLSDYQQMKNAILSTPPFEKVGYLQLHELSDNTLRK